jgi:hypothetical protein
MNESVLAPRLAPATAASLIAAALAAVVAAVNEVPNDTAHYDLLSDADLVKTQHALAGVQQLLASRAASAAGVIAHRSRRELGKDGLAQREGFRTPEAMVQHHTGVTSREASTLVTVGTMTRASRHPEHGEQSCGEPWLRVVGAAAGDGSISLGAARSIRSGLGTPSADESGVGVTERELSEAASRLVNEAPGLNADQLFRLAKDLRDELDAAGIASRERAVYENRSLRRMNLSNGATRFIIDGDLESSAYLNDLYDKVTSPRRGGPRFIDPDEKAWAEEVASDDRSLEQYAHDAIFGIMRIGVAADTLESRRIVGARQPSVRLLAVEQQFLARTGHGRIEGVATPVSHETVERAVCTAGSRRLTLDDNLQPLNLGRESRLFTHAQRLALAARDGGCMWTGCDRPPSWTEAHHISFWARDEGRTDIADGILLCRHHHMLAHNNHWEIERDSVGQCWLVPPPDIDRHRMPRALEPKSAVVRDLRRAMIPKGVSTG